MSHLPKTSYDVDVSDIEIEIGHEIDPDKKRLMELNFRESETAVGKPPFPHWTISRQIMQSQTNMLADEGPAEAKLMLKEFVRD